jgi:hypothetical protein
MGHAGTKLFRGVLAPTGLSRVYRQTNDHDRNGSEHTFEFNGVCKVGTNSAHFRHKFQISDNHVGVDIGPAGKPDHGSRPGDQLAPPAGGRELNPLAFTKVAFPAEEKGSGTTVKALTNKEKLAKALKACRRGKGKSKRQSCERAARRKFPVAKAKKKGRARK